MLTTPIPEVWSKLNAKLHGHYQYYHVNDNWHSLMVCREHARRMAKRHLNRRSQKTWLNWEKFNEYVARHGLASPRKVMDLIAMSRAGGRVHGAK
jgi:hypothetical protein